jgi:hypothetical protein
LTSWRFNAFLSNPDKMSRSRKDTDNRARDLLNIKDKGRIDSPHTLS